MRGATFQFSPPHRGHPPVLSVLPLSLCRFQFSPPHRGHLDWDRTACVEPRFNSRPRTGGIRTCIPVLLLKSGFNSRPRTGGIHLRTTNRSGAFSVSILAPAQGASNLIATALGAVGFQFSPPHRGHHCVVCGVSWHLIVSILAPAQGASSSAIA